MRRLVAFCLVGFLFTPAFCLSQEFECQTSHAGPDTLSTLGFGVPYTLTKDDRSIQVYIHIIRETDGTGGYSDSEVKSLWVGLLDDFDSAGMSFYLAGTEFIDNSSWYDNVNVSIGSAIFSYNYHSDAIDVYLGAPLLSPTGYAEDIPSTALVAYGATHENSALTHLVGHCLGLYHTHETQFLAEYPDSSDSYNASAGDLVLDTSPDPGLSTWVNSSCEIDPGFYSMYPNHHPDPSNFMSGGDSGCWGTFSSEQQNRMQSVLAELPGHSALLKIRNDVFIDQTEQSELDGVSNWVDYPLAAVSIDYNGDGLKEIIVSGKADALGTNVGILCEAYGIVDNDVVKYRRDASAFPDEQLIGGATGLIAGDYDNDGNIDFYAANAGYSDAESFDRTHQLFRNSGMRTFREVTGDVALPVELRTVTGSWADYDGDSFLDLLLLTLDADDHLSSYLPCQGAALYHNVAGEDGERSFVNVTSSDPDLNGIEWVTSALWADFDQDHDVDLILMQSAGVSGEPHSRYLENLGNGAFENVTVTKLADSATHWRRNYGYGVVADYDNDLDLDVAYHNHLERGLFLNNYNTGGQVAGGDGSLSVDWHESPSSGPGWHMNVGDLEACDYNLDGAQDLIAPTIAAGYPTLALTGSYPYDSSVGLVRHEVASSVHDCVVTEAVCATDFSGRGSVHLMLPRRDNTLNHQYYVPTALAGGDRPNWVGVKLVSPAVGEPVRGENNFCGIGSTVMVVADNGFRQAQVVDGGSGRSGQHDLDLVFGLGTYSGDVQITVLWPNGTTIELENMPTGQYHRINDACPTIQAGTQTFSAKYFPNSVSMEWLFMWETDNPGEYSEDEILLYPPAGCSLSYTELRHGSPSTVEVTIEPTSAGTYLHRLSWKSADCVPTEFIPWDIVSGAGSCNDTLEQAGQIYFRMCIGTPAP